MSGVLPHAPQVQPVGVPPDTDCRIVGDLTLVMAGTGVHQQVEPVLVELKDATHLQRELAAAQAVLGIGRTR